MRQGLSIAGIFGLLAFAHPAHGGNTSDLQGLLDETVVTTASKAAETGTNAPATSTMLSADDIRRYGIHTIDEAINFLALGASAYNPLYTPDVASRGVGLDNDRGDHFLLLVDGHAMNDAMFGLARYGRGLGVPLELIDHVEIILGPGAVLYGSNAMLGVINVVTKRAKDYKGVHALAETEIDLSYRAGLHAATPFSVGDTQGEIVVGAEYFNSQGPSFQFGPQNAGINQYTGQLWKTRREGPADGIWGGKNKDTPFTYVPSAYLSARLGDFTLRLQAATFKFDAPYRARFIQESADFDDPDTYTLERAARADLTWQHAVSQLVTLKVRGYADSFDRRAYINSSEKLICYYRGVSTCGFNATTVSQWGGAELQGSFNWARDGSVVTLLGVDGRWRFGESRGDLTNFDTGANLVPSGNIIKRQEPLLGPYIQNTWQPAPWFALNAGARLDYDPRFDPVISPRAAVTTKPWQSGTFKVIYAEAFRAPSFYESDYAGFITVRAKNLKPETVRSIEASVEQRAGSHRFLFGAFRSWWENMIEGHILTAAEKSDAVAAGEIALGVTAGNVSQARNVASIENYGFNTTYEGSVDGGRFRYAANVTGAVARRVAGAIDRPLTLAPGIFGNARVSYDFQGDYPAIALAGHFTGRRIADRAWDGGFAVYPIAPPSGELRATISGPVPLVAGLSYRLSANYVLFGAHGPYVVGFTQGGNDITRDIGELVPTDKFRATVGLQYDLFR